MNRNAQYRDIVSRVNSGSGVFDICNNFDHLFWCGDLNYRVELQRSIVLDVLQEPEVDQYWEMVRMLQSLDQLNNERAAGKAFPGFQGAHRLLNFLCIFNVHCFILSLRAF